MTHPFDEQHLLDEISVALGPPPDVPDPVLRAARAAFTWRTVDAELAELLHDSALAVVPSGLRDSALTTRSLTFQAGDSTLLVDITGDGIVGQLVPPESGTAVLRTTTALYGPFPVDDLGWFRTPVVPREAFRLVLRAGDGRRTVTGEISA